ncbi:MAG: S8 family serine peptidase [Alphaproteobacteria bacterium]|nr:S8 family serine peptidase [Alphaproteobacteria bacterium]
MLIKPTQKAINKCLEIIKNNKVPSYNDFDPTDIPNQETISALSSFIRTQQIINFDMSDIDIPYEEYMLGELVPGQFTAWTDNIKWPQSIIQTINPEKMLNDAKHPVEMDSLHNSGFTGENIGIAIIDQRLNCKHPEYAQRIKHYEEFGIWPKNEPDYHGSLVTGCAVGKNTGTAPGADLYYFAANNWVIQNKFLSGTEMITGIPLKPGHRKYINQAIRRVLEINKTLPENRKIRFLSCSWGQENDQFAEETYKLFAECEREGIMVIGGALVRNNGVKYIRCDKRFAIKAIDAIGIPTNGKTTPFYRGGYYYTRNGGASSTFPYLAGVYACACQGNALFFTRPNWQDELEKMLQTTAIEHPVGGKMINPFGIRNRVSEIVKQMKMDLMIQKATTRHE